MCPPFRRRSLPRSLRTLPHPEPSEPQKRRRPPRFLPLLPLAPIPLRLLRKKPHFQRFYPPRPWQFLHELPPFPLPFAKQPQLSENRPLCFPIRPHGARFQPLSALMNLRWKLMFQPLSWQSLQPYGILLPL